MLQFTTTSHAVRTSGKATEDPLISGFLSSFRCKCWTLNVILLQNCSNYLINTSWSMKTIKTWVFFFCDRVPEWRMKTSPRLIGQYYTRRWTYAAISSIYPATFWGLSTREWLCFPSNAALRFSSYNDVFSKRKLKCDFFWLRLIVCIFAYGSKVVLYFFTARLFNRVIMHVKSS